MRSGPTTGILEHCSEIEETLLALAAGCADPNFTVSDVKDHVFTLAHAVQCIRIDVEFEAVEYEIKLSVLAKHAKAEAPS